jgi:hypothetical protein
MDGVPSRALSATEVAAMKLYYFTTGTEADKLAAPPHFTEAVKMFDSARHRHARSLKDDHRAAGDTRIMLVIDLPDDEARRYATDSPGEYSVPADVANAYRAAG